MAKELTKEEKKIKSKSTGQVLEDFYISKVDKKGKNQEQIKSAALDLYLKSITDKDDAANAEMKRLQDEADAEDAKFNADLAAQREQTIAQLTPRESSKRKPPANYLTQEQVQAQNAIDEKQSKMVPIKEPEYTSAGKAGKGIREGIGSAIGYTGDVLEEYVNQPIENLPKYVGNTSNAIMEGIGGLAGQPVKLGRQEYTDIRTRFDKKEPYPTEAPEKPQPLSEQEPTPETAPAPKEALKKAYAVVFAGSRVNKNATFDNPEDAKKYYNEVIKAPKEDRTFSSMNEAANFYAKEAGTKVNKNKEFKSLKELKNYYESKGSVKGGVITLSPQEKETAQEQAERIAYGQTKKQTEDRKVLKQKLTETGKQAWAEAKKVRDAENAANKASFQKFQESTGSDRQALDAYNEYNKDQSLLKKAYNAALNRENYGAAIKIKDQISRTSANVPVEMGQRQKYFREQAPVERKSSIERETVRRKKVADDLAIFEKNKKANEIYMASNPDSTLNQPTQVKEPSDDEDSYLNFGTPFRSRR